MNLAANDTAAPSKVAPLKVWELRRKDRKVGGKTYPGHVTEGHHAEIVPGVSIRLFGMTLRADTYRQDEAGRNIRIPGEEQVYRTDFKVGGWAACGGYNLTYTGKIRSITAKTVTVVEYEGSSSEKVHRFDLCDFDAYNWDFDMVKIAQRNTEWRD